MNAQDTELVASMAAALGEALGLWKQRQAEYGPGNVAMMGEFGVVTRLNDKVQRIKNLINKPNESLRDSWLDAINYAAMGLLLRDGKWPLGDLSDDPAKCPHCGRAL